MRAETCLRICLDSPHEEFWDLGGVLYVGRNGAGTLLREECDSVTTVVSLEASLRCFPFTNSFPRNSSSLQLEFF